MLLERNRNFVDELLHGELAIHLAYSERLFISFLVLMDLLRARVEEMLKSVVFEFSFHVWGEEVVVLGELVEGTHKLSDLSGRRNDQSS